MTVSMDENRAGVVVNDGPVHGRPSAAKEPKSVQLPHWPEPTVTVDQSLLDSSVYMRDTVKTMRDAELSLLKMLTEQGQAGPGDVRPEEAARCPHLRHALVPGVAGPVHADRQRGVLGGARQGRARAPHPARAHQGQARDAVRASVQEAHGAVRYAHRVQPHRVILRGHGAHEILPYLKRTLNLADAEVLSVEEAKSKDLSVLTKALIESAEPGNPAFE